MTLVPYLRKAGEIKTKPTQHSVKELRSIGLQPDILVCRSEAPIPDSQRGKIALFTNVEERGVVGMRDIDTIYQGPLELHAQGLDAYVVEQLQLECPEADLSDWQRVVDAQLAPKQEVKIAFVGKYLELLDAYKSLIEAITHAGIKTETKVHIDYVDAEALESKGTSLLEGAAAVLVPVVLAAGASKAKFSPRATLESIKCPILVFVTDCMQR